MLTWIVERDAEWYCNVGMVTYIEIEYDTVYVNFPYARKEISCDKGRAKAAMVELARCMREGHVFMAKNFQNEEPAF